MRIKKIFIVVILLNVCEVYSRPIAIKGNIKDFNGSPVELVTIQMQIDHKVYQSALSDSLGNYNIKTAMKGDCALLANVLGYSTTQKRFTLNNDTTIDFILQPDTIRLKEVTIIDRKLIRTNAGGYVAKIDGRIETKGKETTDILKQLPTISVSERSLKILGKSSVIVYVNDRIVRLDGQSLLSYLNSLPPDIINSVEVISTPPAQYDAEGNVGIIKIVTKKNILQGWKENVKTNFIKNNFLSNVSSIFASYSGKKMFFDGTLNAGNYSYLNQNEYSNYFPGQTVTTFNPKKWRLSSMRLLSTFGYNLNENTNFAVDLQVPFYNKETVGDIKNQTQFINSNNNQTDSTIYSNGETIKNNYTYNSEVFFKHLFSNKVSCFSASMAYLHNDTKNRRTIISATQINNVNLTTDDFYTIGSLNYNILTAKLDFIFPIHGWIINTGLKSSFIKTASLNNLFGNINGNNMLDSTQSNRYNYTENVQSVYCSMEKNTPKWSFKWGIRSEYTNTSGYSLITDKRYKDRYINFFPTIYLARTLNDGNSISLSYSDRIERPPYQYLDPFRWYISKYDYAEGNPYLKPSYIKNVELSFLFNSTFSTKIYYMVQNNKFGQYVVLDSFDIIKQIQKTDNFLNEKDYGLYIYKFLKMFKCQETVLQFDISYSEFISNRREFSNSYGIGNSAIMNNTFFLNKNIQAVFNLEEHIPGIYEYRKMKNYFNMDVGFNYVNHKKNFAVSLLASDVFKTASPSYYYISEGIKQVYRNYADTRMIKLAISWKFGNWNNKTLPVSSPSNEEEKQRL